MGKRKVKSAGDSKVASFAPDEPALPSFDEQALSALTEKIEIGFLKAPGLETNFRQKHKSMQVKSVGSSVRRPSKFKEEAEGSAMGRKRDSRGNVKELVNGRLETHRFVKDRPKRENKDEQGILLQEILALGGTEEDLDLVVGVASDEGDVDSEPVDRSVLNSKFTKELSEFVTGLGLEGHAIGNLSGSESGENEGDELGDGRSKSPSLPNVGVKAGKASTSSDDKTSDKLAKGLNCLTFEARPDWHAAVLPDLPLPGHSESVTNGETISELKKHALTLLETDSSLYASKHLSSTSSHRFLSTIMSSGTLSDKVSALTLVVQESPVHTIKSFENLLALAKKRSRGQAVIALGAIKDLLSVGVVLPANRRLRPFESQPGLLGTLQVYSIPNWKSGSVLPGNITSAHMISWAYEDWLKDTYFDVLKVLESWCNDEVEFARGRAVTYVYELLREKPEQESNLLRLLVNKLGDPDKKIASRTSYLILQLQTTHPLMKSIIVRAIESELLLRPGQSLHAKYYAINTLNQTILSGKEEEVARKLLSVYFDLFVTLLKKQDIKKGATGPVVNRKGHIQGGGGQAGKKAKEKARKDDIAKQSSEETTEKLISAVLTGVNRAFPFAKSDDLTLEKHMDMLFKITHSSNFNTSIQALMLIQQLAASKQICEDRFYRTLYESLLDPRLVTSSKHTMYLNLLYRALKSDLNVKRVKAFAKRLLQVITLHQPPFICGALYLLRELEGTFQGLTSLLDNPEEHDEMYEEMFLDVPDGVLEALSAAESPQVNFVHPYRAFIAEKKPNGYDGRKRDPEHSNADTSCLWELLPFVSHFHPSVSMFASRLLYRSEMPPRPDITSHSLIHFLDKFVYRNAKAAAGGLRGSSIMQPLAGGESPSVFLSNRVVQDKNIPLNSEAFWRKKAEDIAVDEVFFHRYFSHAGKGKEPAGKKRKLVQSAEHVHDEDGDGESEDEIWQALVESRPEVESHSEIDSDLEMLDLDSEDDSSVDANLDFETEDDEEAPSKYFEDKPSQDAEGADTFLDSMEDSPSDMKDLFNKELGTSPYVGATTGDKRGRKNKRRQFKNLPTFASTEEYAEMLEDDEDI